jgi:hypothetical protein
MLPGSGPFPDNLFRGRCASGIARTSVSSSSPTYPTLSCSTTPVTLQQSFGTYFLSLTFFHVCRLLPRDILSLSNSLPLIGTGQLRHGPHSLPLAISLLSQDATLLRDALIPRPSRSACIGVMIPPLSSSLGSYHNVECASECLSRVRTNLPSPASDKW